MAISVTCVSWSPARTLPIGALVPSAFDDRKVRHDRHVEGVERGRRGKPPRHLTGRSRMHHIAVRTVAVTGCLDPDDPAGNPTDDQLARERGVERG
jgi:hypothetical protein